MTNRHQKGITDKRILVYSNKAGFIMKSKYFDIIVVWFSRFETLAGHFVMDRKQPSQGSIYSLCLSVLDIDGPLLM